MKTHVLGTVILATGLLGALAQTNSPLPAPTPASTAIIRQAKAPWPSATTNTIAALLAGKAQVFNSGTNRFQKAVSLKKDDLRAAISSATRGTVIASSVVERGAHHRVVRNVTQQTNELGTVVTRTNSYTELATGMHYQENGEWKETKELIEPYGGGAIARFGPHKVIFAENLNTSGVIDMETADGKRLRSHVIGLSYQDTASGKNVLIAEVKECVGQIVGSNQVVYADAFTDVKADVRYTYTKAGFEQDIILRTQPPSPKEYGLDPETTHLQVLTEFLNPPQPVKGEQLLNTAKGVIMSDELLDFGEMKIGAGRAFAVGQENNTDIPVTKRWLKIEGRDFLIEEMAVPEIAEELKSLPKSAFRLKGNRNGRLAKVERQLPETRKSDYKASRRMLAAQQTASEPGFVLDYVALGGATGYTFKGDTTHYVSGYVALYGTTTFEGGAVIKYAPDASINIAPSYPYGTLVPGSAVFRNDSYRPVIFTAQDDDSVGEALAGISSGDPGGQYYGNPALFLAGSSSANPGITNVHFCFAKQAVSLGGYSVAVGHAQFVNCETGFKLGGSTASVRNTLFTHVKTNFLSIGGGVVNGQHVTVDDSFAIMKSPGSPSGSTVTLINSILANVTALSSGYSPVVQGFYNGFYNSPQFGGNQFPTASNPFQLSGGGSYYLGVTSDLRAKGTVSPAVLDPQLLNALKTKTTQPPIVIPRFTLISGEMTLFPQIPRYVSGSPDLGYHYDPMDYTVAALGLAGGTLHVQPGTVVGVRVEYVPEWEWWWPFEWTYMGLDLIAGSKLISHGTPTKPIVFTDVQTVQETSFFPVFALICPDYWPSPDNLSPPSADFRFSNFSLLSGWGYHFLSGQYENEYRWLISPDSSIDLSLRNCEFRRGKINLGPGISSPVAPPPFYGTGQISLENNLFERTKCYFDPNYPAWWAGDEIFFDVSFIARNNLFKDGILRLVPSATSSTWTLKDNLFDKTAFEQDSTFALDHDFNGYWKRSAAELEVGQTDRLVANNGDGSTDALNDKVLTSAPTYQTGPLGNYCLPASGSLFNGGSRTAAEAGLFHYTTQANQTKEGSEGTGNMVNIGLHYVATANSSSATPRDTDGDGVYDYVENWHGDGDYASHTDSETDPALAMTDGVTPDASSTIYDDIDLDADGLKGAAERWLGRNPVFPDNPLVLPSVQTVSGILDVPLSLSLPNPNSVLRLYVNGEENGLGEAVQVNATWHAKLDTFGLANGLYALQLAVSFSEQPDHTHTARGIPAFITANNIVTVHPLSRMFTDMLHIEAAVNIPADSYSVEVRNDAGTLLNTLTGPVQSGWISDSWYLKDGEGNSIVSGPLQATVTINAGGASVTSPPVRFNLVKHITGQAFTIAYASYRFPRSDLCIGNSIVDILRAGEGFDPEDYDLLPQYHNTPYSDNPFEWYADSSNKSTLTDALADANSANFYWMGHGTPYSIFPDREDFAEYALYPSEVSSLLGNRGQQGNGIYNNHPYRLVILDGCSTWSMMWAQAWGLPATVFAEVPKADFLYFGLDPSAYVGWTVDTYQQSYSADTRYAYQRCLAQLFLAWRSNSTLRESLEAYNAALNDPANSYYLHLFDSWRIAGCGDLRTSDR